MPRVHIYSHYADQWIEIDGVRVPSISRIDVSIIPREPSLIQITVLASDLTIGTMGMTSASYVDPITGETFTRETPPPYDASV